MRRKVTVKRNHFIPGRARLAAAVIAGVLALASSPQESGAVVAGQSSDTKSFECGNTCATDTCATDSCAHLDEQGEIVLSCAANTCATDSCYSLDGCYADTCQTDTCSTLGDDGEVVDTCFTDVCSTDVCSCDTCT